MSQFLGIFWTKLTTNCRQSSTAFWLTTMRTVQQRYPTTRMTRRSWIRPFLSPLCPLERLGSWSFQGPESQGLVLLTGRNYYPTRSSLWTQSHRATTTTALLVAPHLFTNWSTASASHSAGSFQVHLSLTLFQLLLLLQPLPPLKLLQLLLLLQPLPPLKLLQLLTLLQPLPPPKFLQLLPLFQLLPPPKFLQLLPLFQPLPPPKFLQLLPLFQPLPPPKFLQLLPLFQLLPPLKLLQLLTLLQLLL